MSRRTVRQMVNIIKDVNDWPGQGTPRIFGNMGCGSNGVGARRLAGALNAGGDWLQD
jgi:hypothetical protein